MQDSSTALSPVLQFRQDLQDRAAFLMPEQWYQAA